MGPNTVRPPVNSVIPLRMARQAEVLFVASHLLVRKVTAATMSDAMGATNHEMTTGTSPWMREGGNDEVKGGIRRGIVRERAGSVGEREGSCSPCSRGSC